MRTMLPIISAVISSVVICVGIPSAAVAGAQEKTMKTMTVKKLTANLYTEDVAACVKFWVDRLHFEKAVEVPEPGGLAFALLKKGDIEVMYGSYASLQQEPLAAGSFQTGTGFLFVEVDALDPVAAAMKDLPKAAEVHETFYGSTEFTVKDPAGHLITFAQFKKSPSTEPTR
jgi:uncharacterized glyoxalase superfamily protein PhnB